MSKKVSTRNTKAEILSAYEELIKQTKDSDSQSLIQTPTNSRESDNEAGKHNLNSKLKKLRTESTSLVNNFLEDLLQNLEEKITDLNEVESKINEENSKLEEIFKIQAKADSLKQLIEIEENERRRWEQEKRQFKMEFEQEKREIEMKRKEEDEEYKFKTAKTRREEIEKFEIGMSEKKKQFEEDRKMLDESIDELTELREVKENYEQEINNKVTEALTAQEKMINNNHKHETQINLKNHENEIKILKIQIENLEADNKRLMKEISEMKQKVEKSEDQMKEVALSVIDSNKINDSTFKTESKVDEEK